MSIGLDLGNHSIKIVELEKVSNSVVLSNFAVFESDKLKLDLNDEDALNLYISKLKSYFKEIDFKSKDVVLSIPDTEVFVTIKNLPKMKEKEIREYIPLQASDVFPENIASLIYDIKILKELDNNLVEVLLVGARKQRVEKYIEIVKRSGLVPKILEPKSISNARLVDEMTNNKANIVLDFGYNQTNLEISLNKIPRFVKSISIGSNSMNKALSQNLDLSLLQAEEYKKTYGLISGIADDKILEYLKPLVDSIILDLKRSIVYFVEKNKGVEINKIYLMGGLANLPGLPEYLVQNLNFNVEVFNLFSKIKVASTLGKFENELKNISPILSNAVGASLGQIYE